MTLAPLRHQFLYRNKVVGSAWDLPRPETDRLWSNLGWALGPADNPPEVDRWCKRCGATWVGTELESCWWCERAHEALIAAQRTVVLMDPDMPNVLDCHDKEIQRTADAWSARLAVARAASLVSAVEADEAVKAWLEKVTRWRQP